MPGLFSARATMKIMTFNQHCLDLQLRHRSSLCVGLDPDLTRLPEGLRHDTVLASVEQFCKGIIQATAAYACAFKPQIAYFASLSAEPVLEDLGHWIKKHYPTHLWLLDAKRGDIGATAEHYAVEAFDRYRADAVTLSPYMGLDSLSPFLSRERKGVFLLCRTSNKGGDDLQMESLSSGLRVFEHLAQKAEQQWNGTGQIGLVAGATYPEDITSIRRQAPSLPLLIPGIGAQGGDLLATVKAAQTNFLINASRSILYASAQSDWQQAAAREAEKLKTAIEKAKVQ